MKLEDPFQSATGPSAAADTMRETTARSGTPEPGSPASLFEDEGYGSMGKEVRTFMLEEVEALPRPESPSPLSKKRKESPVQEAEDLTSKRSRDQRDPSRRIDFRQAQTRTVVDLCTPEPESPTPETEPVQQAAEVVETRIGDQSALPVEEPVEDPKTSSSSAFRWPSPPNCRRCKTPAVLQTADEDSPYYTRHYPLNRKFYACTNTLNCRAVRSNKKTPGVMKFISWDDDLGIQDSLPYCWCKPALPARLDVKSETCGEFEGDGFWSCQFGAADGACNYFSEDRHGAMGRRGPCPRRWKPISLMNAEAAEGDRS